jgi:hypothetical protein
MNCARKVRPILALFVLATVVPLAGCDWLDPSGSESRSSPVLTDLRVSPASVFCSDPDREPNTIAVSFGYSDPQDDIYLVRFILERTSPEWTFEDSTLWNDLDLATSPGRAIGEIYFECGGPPAGAWTLTVQAEDERGHLSNELTTGVTLLSD